MAAPNRTKILYTVLIFLESFCLGISGTIMGPSLIDLCFVYNVPLKLINYSVVGATLGGLIGSLSGFIYKWINRQLWLALMLTLLAISMMLIPVTNRIVWLYLEIFVSGISDGAWYSCINVWLVQLWPQSNGFFLQTLQFMYGIGTIIGPTMTSPFLYGLKNSTDITVEKRQRSLMIPFGITSAILLIVPVILFVLYFVKRFEAQPQTNDLNNNDDGGEQNKDPRQNVQSQQDQIKWRKIKLVLVALSLASFNSVEGAFFYYSSTMFQYSAPKLSAPEAAHVLAVLNIFYTIGMFCTALLSLRIPPDMIIIQQYTMMIAAQVLLYFRRDSIKMVYVANALTGFGFSATAPAFQSFTERHLRLTNKVGTLLFITSSTFPAISVLVLTGYLPTHPEVLYLHEVIFLSISILTFTIVKLLIKFK